MADDKAISNGTELYQIQKRVSVRSYAIIPSKVPLRRYVPVASGLRVPVTVSDSGKKKELLDSDDAELLELFKDEADDTLEADDAELMLERLDDTLETDDALDTLETDDADEFSG